MKAELRHVGVGCNRVVNAVSWKHENGLIAYAAHHAVIIYDPQVSFFILPIRPEINFDFPRLWQQSSYVLV